MFKVLLAYISKNKFLILGSLVLMAFSVFYFFYSMQSGSFVNLRESSQAEWMMRGWRFLGYSYCWYLISKIIYTDKKKLIRKMLIGAVVIYEGVVVFNFPKYLMGL